MLICRKIKQTMRGVGRVSIQNYHGSYISIFNPASIHRLVSLSRAKGTGKISSASGCPMISESKDAKFLPECVAPAYWLRMMVSGLRAPMGLSCLFRCVWEGVVKTAG